VNAALGLLETHGLTPAMVAIDAMAKTAEVRVLQVELNDLCGVSVQVTGSTADVQEALTAGAAIATTMAGRPVSHLIRRVAGSALPGIASRPEYNPLIQQNVVLNHGPAGAGNAPPNPAPRTSPSSAMKPNSPPALGFIETQGFTAVLEALDTACKAADVAVIGKEKLGGGYVTVVVQGELSAVTAAIEASKTKVEGLGKLIAAHVIARPHEAVISLLPRL
jgi:microcompartment protein CcmL/EutN